MVQTILTQLENVAYRLQLWYMKPKMTSERVSRHFAFFHPRPTGKIVMEEYRKRLQGPTLKILITGCFDVLHIEHKKFLRAAKALGGRLLVGVETDARVRQLKGPGRPVNQLAVRLRALRRLGIADEVFTLPNQFNDLNHFTNLIKKLRPDILAVSSSTPNLPVKRKIMKQIGGRVVVVLTHNPKISTTKMIKSKHG
ncbi:hypothetical protein COX09_03840 [Candidatus Beckwithbacteria bacterium CG23_combo_of_CG06-09_8_20_14_all_47_9]|uniref:Cytidyltransferase-like domain-containing protein n=3 Tax=Candidatus Beckwithiibacteriota TaxID=1752726 RepID=A0A2H0B4R4_9BACT|nr:MAG: hypothetical protein COX09_03840 [Candidatus Beckwithbacteria bacterium CG23_combo_of_CG06-09_8_20_14_all_47_9]